MDYSRTQYYYTKNKINKYTWITFAEFYNLRNLKDVFIENNYGFGWDDTLLYKQDGEVLFINKRHEAYKGIWFILNDIRIVILEDKKM